MCSADCAHFTVDLHDCRTFPVGSEHAITSAAWPESSLYDNNLRIIRVQHAKKQQVLSMLRFQVATRKIFMNNLLSSEQYTSNWIPNISMSIR